MHHQRDAVVLAVNFWHCIDTGKGKTKITEVVREGLGRLSHLIGVVWLARNNLHQRLELILAIEIVAFKLHA